ncbi:MAG: hypothetical protein A2830_00035 [Candidatus Taylorbacteria bacterium RIFCSPHIGHO2_01_FULL_44_110]|nr:MAG: hypothetical protein A2830_00035 [Candidatus Taylorbacteria bacterium RIFCSPHIGHO2_01_FULL_44_110]OHA39652.1 MAG: hypothetical protein A3I98_04070 [Candidatus Taylorbacteria bacterium RIFCSPLOWO2_02_FULL_45_10b]
MRHFLTFKEISNEQLDPNIIGGKAEALARLYQKGFTVPDGFVISTEFFESFPKENMPIKFFDQDIKKIYRYIDACSPRGLVAVRSSASTEDSNTQSFAGQFDSFLNVKKEQVLVAVEKCLKSLHNTRAESYAQGKNSNIKMAVIVQNMVTPEISGVAFSTNPVTGDKNSVIIEAVAGSNELLVQGAVTPDYYAVSKNLKMLDKKVIPQNEISQQKLSDQQLLNITQLVIDVSRFFNTEVDIEWAIEKDKLYILQSRPITAIQYHNAKRIF